MEVMENLQTTMNDPWSSLVLVAPYLFKTSKPTAKMTLPRALDPKQRYHGPTNATQSAFRGAKRIFWPFRSKLLKSLAFKCFERFWQTSWFIWISCGPFEFNWGCFKHHVSLCFMVSLASKVLNRLGYSLKKPKPLRSLLRGLNSCALWTFAFPSFANSFQNRCKKLRTSVTGDLTAKVHIDAQRTKSMCVRNGSATRTSRTLLSAFSVCKKVENLIL